MEIQEEEKVIPCILCPKSCGTDCQLIDDGTRKIMAMLLLKLDLDENGPQLICNLCISNPKTCFDFKSSVLSSLYSVRSPTHRSNELDQFTSTTKECSNRDSLLSLTTCILCKQLVNKECSILNDTKRRTFVRILLEKYFPELNLEQVREFSVCVACDSLLQTFCDIMRNWSAENIFEHNTLMAKTITNGEILPQFGHDYRRDSEFLKSEVQDEVTEESSSVELKLKEFNIKKEECDITVDQNGYERLEEILPQVEGFKCNTDLHQPLNEFDLDNHLSILTNIKVPKTSKSNHVSHMITDQNIFNYSLYLNPTQATLYECDKCDYKAKRKQSLIEHIKKHQDKSNIPKHTEIYQCDKCEIKVKCKGSLQRHMSTHHNTLELTIYQCEKCQFKTKYKYNLKEHALTHLECSETVVYLCEKCNYKTKNKHNLKSHTMTHQDPSEVKMYECYKCEFRTKRKHCLKTHMLLHRTSSEMELYQCTICEYKTKYKRNLMLHKVIHQDPSKVRKYQCEVCDYETKWKDRLRKHTLVHKSDAETPMYSCNVCGFKTKHKGYIKLHARHMHNDGEEKSCRGSSETLNYQCDVCKFVTKRKSSLISHMVVHKTDSEAVLFRCNVCKYKTKRKSDLKRHMRQRHKLIDDKFVSKNIEEGIKR